MDKFQRMVIEDLKKLGKNQTEIVAGLKKRKIKGQLQTPESCPLANYLSKEYNTDVTVGHETITLNGVTVDTPPVFVKFIKAFDIGQYPELDENAS